MDQNALYLAYMQAELDRWEAYHNHKESMAWTATAAFVPGVLLFANLAKPTIVRAQSGWVIAAALLFCLVALLFVSMQYQMRWDAADMQDGFRLSIGHLLAGTVSLSPQETRLPNYVPGSVRSLWPPFVADCLLATQTERRKPLLRGLLLLPVPFLWGRIDGRVRSELASYLIIVGSVGSACFWILAV